MAKEEKKTERKRGKIKDSGKKPNRGLNKLPGYLRNDKNLPDWLAGSIVIVGGGLILCLVVGILAVAWPG